MNNYSFKHIEIKLASVYIKKHFRQFAAVVIVAAIFASTLFSLQLFKGAVENTLLAVRLDTYGHFSGAAFNADTNNADLNTLSQNDAGIVSVCGKICANDDYINFGTVDSNAQRAIGIEFKEGAMPKNESEIALSYTSYTKLGQYVNIGECILLDVADENGGTYTKSCILSGIMYDYVDIWNEAFEDVENHDIPEIIIGNPQKDALFSHIVFGDSYVTKINTTPNEALWCGGKYYVNWFSVNGSAGDEEEQNKQINTITLIATIVLAGIVFVGIKSVTQITFANQQNNLQLLRCIGITPKQTLNVFMLQGLWISVFSSILGGVFGVVLLFCAIKGYNLFGYEMMFSFSGKSLLLAASISFLTVLLSYSIQIRKVLEKSEVETFAQINKKHSSHIPKSANTLYRDTVLKAQHKANTLSGVLVVLTVAVSIVAVYATNLYIHDIFKSDKRTSEALGIDYCYRATGGAELPHALNTEINRAVGITKENLDKISNNGEIELVMSCTGDFATAFLYDDGTYGKTYEHIDEYHSIKYNYDMIGMNGDETLAKFGFSENEDLYNYSILGVPFEQLSKFDSDLFSGKLDNQAFENGTQAAYIGNEFDVGDVVSIAIFDFDKSIDGIDDENDENLYSPKITVLQLTIGAVFNPDESSRIANMLGRSIGEEGLIISDEIMLKADNQLNYSYVWVDRTSNSQNETDIEMTEAFLLDIFSQCETNQLEFKNYSNVEQQQKALATKYAAPYVFIGALLVILILISFIVTNVSSRNSFAKTHSILSALGMTGSAIRHLTLLGNLEFCLIRLAFGIMIGISSVSVISIVTKTPLETDVMTNVCIIIGTIFFVLFAISAVLSGLMFKTENNNDNGII